ncbi:MAG: ImmA/IrrE family metallo-endopeptidase [Sphingomonadales bacterium]|nr:MAG: ImmA/IrrE family metallo-endopeptidase [Sphingomonadales bacterium]
MAATYAEAVRGGAMEAGRLHRRLGTQQSLSGAAGSVDVFSAIAELGVPLILKPLKNLLGAFLNEPVPGILVTTERPMSIQRFTAAHELGHFGLNHQPSLDDDSILRRMATAVLESTTDYQEVEADAFAIAFLMPKWLILFQCQRHGWTIEELKRADIVYQLSLRLGTSYEATYRTLRRYELIDGRTMRDLGATAPRDLKVALLGDYRPANYRGDVWLLTDRDAGAQIDGSCNDLFVIRLEERSGSGYIWSREQLAASGYVVVRDSNEALDSQTIGSPTMRHLTVSVDEAERGPVSLSEQRPWAPSSPLATILFKMDFTGPEREGLSRAERRSRLTG